MLPRSPTRRKRWGRRPIQKLFKTDSQNDKFPCLGQSARTELVAESFAESQLPHAAQDDCLPFVITPLTPGIDHLPISELHTSAEVLTAAAVRMCLHKSNAFDIGCF